MTVIIQEVYNAFKEAGVSEETARDAAEALTGYGDKFHELEREIDKRFNEVDTRFSEIERSMDQRFSEIERLMDQRFSEIERSMDQRFGEIERSMDQRFGEIERSMDQRFNKTDIEVAEIKGTLRLHQWMMGFQLALTTAVLFLILRGGI